MKIVLFFLFIATSVQGASRAQLYSALLSGGLLNPDRQLVHFSNTCALHIGGSNYPVVDMQELVKSDTSPRGINQIVVFDPQLKPVQKIEYTTQRPLFCVDNQLYVFGELEKDDVLPEGNVLTFSERGKVFTLSHVEAKDYPVPVTKNRKSPPQ